MKIRRWISQLAASVLCVGMLAAGQTALGEALTKTITDFEEGQLLFDGSDQWNTEASAEQVDGGLNGSKWQKLHYKQGKQGDMHQKYAMGEFTPVDGTGCRYLSFYAKADSEATFRIYLQADYKGGHAKVTVKDEGWYSVPLSTWTDAVEGFDVKLIHYLQFHFNGFFEGEGNLYVDNLCLTEEDKSIPETPVQPETPKDPPKDMSPEKTRITGFENNQWQFDGSDQWNAEASAEIVDGGLDGSKWQKLHYQQGGLHQKYIMGEFPPIDASKCRYITFYAKADQEVTFRIYLQADYKGGHAKVTVKDEGWYSVPLSEWTTTVKDFDTSQIHFLQFHFNGFFEGEGYLYVDGLCLTEGDYSKGEFDTAGEPETPENPEKPENPENPEKPESPDTGAARSAVLPLAALAAGAVLVTVGIRRKNKR